MDIYYKNSPSIGILTLILHWRPGNDALERLPALTASTLRATYRSVLTLISHIIWDIDLFLYMWIRRSGGPKGTENYPVVRKAPLVYGFAFQ